MTNINLSNFETGDSSFQDLYVYGKLNYDFKDDDVTVKSINVTSPSVFSGDVAFSGDITLDEITCRNANVTGIATVGTGLYVQGKLFDGDGDFGTAGQLLSSDGTDLNWINANTTSVANSINVGTNLDSTNADQFITFVGSNSGNNPIRVDNDLKYNPSTNTLTVGTIVSTVGGTFVSGMIILYGGAADAIPSGFVLCDGSAVSRSTYAALFAVVGTTHGSGNGSTTFNLPDLRGKFVVGHHPSNGDYDVGDTGGEESVTLTVDQIPPHSHVYKNQVAIINASQRPWPANNNDCRLDDADTSSTGGGQSHENRPPYYALMFIVKL